MASGDQRRPEQLWFEYDKKPWTVFENVAKEYKLNLSGLRRVYTTILLNDVANLLDESGWTTCDKHGLQEFLGPVGNEKKNPIKVECMPVPEAAASSGAGDVTGAMSRFKALLVRAGHSTLDEKVLETARKHFAARIILLASDQEACNVYRAAQRWIKSVTRAQLSTQHGLSVNGTLFADVPSRSFFFRTIRDLDGTIQVLVLKIPWSITAADHESEVYKKLKGPGGAPPHLVPVELLEFDRDTQGTIEGASTNVDKGLLLPWYAATLADFPSLHERHLLEIGKQMQEALAHMHTHGLCHCDIKPSNIFFDFPSRCWFLGDYGGSVAVNTRLREWSDKYCKGFDPAVKDIENSSKALDKWLLAVSLLEKLPTPGARLAGSRRAALEMVEDISSQPLKDLIHDLLAP